MIAGQNWVLIKRKLPDAAQEWSMALPLIRKIVGWWFYLKNSYLCVKQYIKKHGNNNI